MLQLCIWIEGEKTPNEFELLTAMAGTVVDRFGPAVRYEVTEEPDFPSQFTETDFDKEEARDIFLGGMKDSSCSFFG